MKAKSTASKMLETLKTAVTRVDAFVAQESKLQSALDYPLKWEKVKPEAAKHLVGGQKITFGRSQGPQADQPASFYMKDDKHLYEIRSRPMGGDDWKNMEYSRTPMNNYVKQVLQANIDLDKIGPKSILSLSKATKEVKLPKFENLDDFVRRGHRLEDHLSSSRNKTWEQVNPEAVRHLSNQDKLLYNQRNVSASEQQETWYKKDDNHLYKFGMKVEEGFSSSAIKVERTPLTREVQHILNSAMVHHKNGPKLLEGQTKRQGPRHSI